MPRTALSRASLLAAGLALAAVRAAGAANPHLDPVALPGQCSACHRGHGQSRSPMLPSAQSPLCLSCHGEASEQARAEASGNLGLGQRPGSLAPVLQQPYTHPLDKDAFSRHEPGKIVCTSCHSPHRGSLQGATEVARDVGPRRSPRDPARFEWELCLDCHGSTPASVATRVDLQRLLDSRSVSAHPVLAPAREPSPSLRPALTGGLISCTDCHGNSDPLGVRGPHGSAQPRLLRAPYQLASGSGEGPASYGLCYSCHQRQRVLDDSPFPEHREHVVEERASCAVCHDAHGSQINRALIRFSDEATLSEVAPSGKTGRLAFESTGPGSGACYLTCHGVDHAPKTYGASELPPEALLGARPPNQPRAIGLPPPSRQRRDRKPEPPPPQPAAQ